MTIKLSQIIKYYILNMISPVQRYRSIIFGLFALIGFIIIVYSIFIAVIGEPLASVADTVFVAALIGSFTLVSTIVSFIFLKK